MVFPRLEYDDFYKFIMSAGIIIFLIGVIGDSYILVSIDSIEKITGYKGFLLILYIIFFLVGIYLMLFSGRKWYQNQKNIDKKTKAEAVIAEQTAQEMIKPEEKIFYPEERNHKSQTALVTYKIASVLPNTVPFNFLKDWKVWFWVANHERKKYRAYVKIKFISDNYEKEVQGGYYGGIKPWNLNALSGIRAPGLDIPNEIKNKAKQRKEIKILINCEIKDENDNKVEEKLPIGYVYDYDNNNWYLEP